MSVLLLSGGLDSAVLLAREVAAGRRPHCLAFRYGQAHDRELACSEALAVRYGCGWVCRSLPRELFAGSALTGSGGIPHAHYADPAQRATVVPNRNMVFLSLAAAEAVRANADAVLFAAHAGDAAVYPDCRPDFVSAADRAMRRACGVMVKAPFLGWTKRDIADLGIALRVPIGETWSCYEGGSEPCHRCGACVEREEALA